MFFIYLKKIFSRNTFYILLLLIQILICLISVIVAVRYFPLTHSVLMVIDIVVVFVIINRRDNPSYKTAWIIFIWIFSLFGGITYLLVRFTSYIQRKIYIRTAHHPLRLHNESDCGLNELFPEYSGLSRYIERCGGFPVYSESSCEYFSSGELQFEAMLKALKAAENFIFMDFYIISKGKMFERISEILVEKASEGVDVSILYDGIGTGFAYSDTIFRSLSSVGIKCRAFNCFTPFLSSSQNNRDHRKIVVIDGKTAFNGGTNIADEYINLTERFGYWKDSAVMIKGKAVKNYTAMFLQLWNTTGGDSAPISENEYDISEKSSGFIQPFSFSPLDREPIGKQVYLELIYSAKRYIHITTPYLLPDDELISALRAAALKNVDVRIITPGKADKKYVQYIARGCYCSLLSAGVRIYEYTPGFIHSKNISVDDKAALVGTINLDYRSMYLQFESAAIMYGCECIKSIEADFAETVSLSKEIDGSCCKERSLREKAAGFILNMFSPLL